jgi:hypothetical protein
MVCADCPRTTHHACAGHLLPPLRAHVAGGGSDAHLQHLLLHCDTLLAAGGGITSKNVERKDTHWYLAVYVQRHRIVILDSAGRGEPQCYENVLAWLAAEHKAKRGSDLDTSDWKLEEPDVSPQQLDGHSCGVFMLLNAWHHCLGLKIDFDSLTEENLERLREHARSIAAGGNGP